MQDNALRTLGLARKAQKLAVGEEPAGVACRAGKARLLIVAQDAGEHTLRRAQSFCRAGKPPYLVVPLEKEALGGALGMNACALCAILDAALAKLFLEQLEGPEDWAPVLAELSRQIARTRQRKTEQKAHQKNVKFGKK